MEKSITLKESKGKHRISLAANGLEQDEVIPFITESLIVLAKEISRNTQLPVSGVFAKMTLSTEGAESFWKNHY